MPWPGPATRRSPTPISWPIPERKTLPSAACASPSAGEDALVALALREVFGATWRPRWKSSASRWKCSRPRRDPARGILLDTKQLEEIGRGLAKEIENLRAEAVHLGGVDFNPASTKQLAQILFEKLGLEVVRKGKTGPSTDADVLEILAMDHPLPRVILDFRSLSKLQNTYVEALPTLIDPATKRLHTSFNQAVAATGRLSSSDPNLQNIPVRSARGREIRRAFIAPRGFRLVVADYSQIELRILAHLSGDEILRRAFREGRDVHEETAEAVGCDRATAKTVNYGLAYGQTGYGLARTLRIPRREADRILSAHQARYPRVGVWIAEAIDTARKRGYAETLWGRRRPPRDHGAKRRRSRRVRKDRRHMPVQGTAADLAKSAMVRVAKSS